MKTIAALFGHLTDDGIGQQLQPLAVAGGLAFFHGQAGVEQQHAVLCPLHQAATGCGNGEMAPQVALHFLKMFCSEGGSRTPLATENASPSACPSHGRGPAPE
jgi:hypothetical protein